MNSANNTNSARVSVHSTAGQPLPIAADFENSGALPANWLLYDANSNGNNWVLRNAAGSGHGSSNYMLYHNNYDFLSGEANYAILPADNLGAGSKLLDFYVAYAQYQNENDRLDVVYSTNCGTSWTSVWNRAGTALSTAPPTNTRFLPTATQWRAYTVDLSAVPANAMLAFRGTSNYGNSLYIDDIQLRSALATVASVPAQSVTLAPNPAAGQAVLAFDLTKSTNVRVDVVDAMGRIVASPATSSLGVGAHQINISTASLAAGLYTVVLRTTEGALTTRLAVVH